MAKNKYPEETIQLIVDEALKLFIQKGYDSTSIQDIINHLGGLSKGAIYHHFKSKEKIFEAVCKKIGKENSRYYAKIRDDAHKNGQEKLQAMIQSAHTNPTNTAMAAMANQMMRDPKFLTNQIFESYELVAPQYIQPIIEQGIQDGSIQTDYPKELAEVLVTLLNIWINPIINKATPEQMYRKILFFSQLLKGIGLDLFDEDTIQQYVLLCKYYNQ